MDLKIRYFPVGEIFHICNKSIALYEIFKTQELKKRFTDTIQYYNNVKVNISLSKALHGNVHFDPLMNDEPTKIIRILAYCIMPDHYHLLIKVKQKNLFSLYMNRIENSYTRYFNTLTKRRGPLWQSTFKAAYIPDNETFLHVHRYIHLNPTTAELVTKPDDYEWSSYRYFISDSRNLKSVSELSIKSTKSYRAFVENHQEYQRKIKYIQKNFLD